MTSPVTPKAMDQLSGQMVLGLQKMIPKTWSLVLNLFSSTRILPPFRDKVLTILGLVWKRSSSRTDLIYPTTRNLRQSRVRGWFGKTGFASVSYQSYTIRQLYNWHQPEFLSIFYLCWRQPDFVRTRYPCRSQLKFREYFASSDANLASAKPAARTADVLLSDESRLNACVERVTWARQEAFSGQQSQADRMVKWSRVDY